MKGLEHLQPTASVRGILSDRLVIVTSVQRFGSDALELAYDDPGVSRDSAEYEGVVLSLISS